MRSRQKKVERRRIHRQKHLREKRVFAFRYQQRLASDVHPLYACMVNRHWRDDGKASILMARRLGEGRVTMAAFLVDLWAMGLKDAWGRTDIAASEFDETVSRAPAELETRPLNLGTAKHIVYGGIELARELGFRLPKRYERWTAILGALPAGESPDMSLFRHDGRIELVCSQKDLEARLIGTTPSQFLSRPDVSYILADDDFTLVDEEADEADNAMGTLEQTMLDRVREWCFAQGETPHPLLPRVISATLEAILQGLPRDRSATECLEALPEAEFSEVFNQVGAFLSASCDGDRDELEAAMAQFSGSVASLDSPEQFIQSLGIPE